jgi:hypothetical protein
MRAVGSAVVCMSIAEVPEGRQRSPYLVSTRTIIRSAMRPTHCRRSDVRTKLSESFPWIPSQRWKPSRYRHVFLAFQYAHH